MTLADLFDALHATGALTRAKDRKSSLLHLAKALGHASLEACPVDAALGHEATWREALDVYFAAILAGGKKLSAHTMGETRTNIRAVFHLAETHALLAAPLPPLPRPRPGRRAFSRERFDTSPFYARYHPQDSPRHYGLPQAEWPPDIAEGWQDYLDRRTKRLRPVTQRSCVRDLQLYFGYLSRYGRDPIRWADVGNVKKVQAFVRWHADRLGCGAGITEQGLHFVNTVTTIAKTVAHASVGDLLALRRTLLETPPVPMHIKRDHTLPLDTLEALAETYLAEGRMPFRTRPYLARPGGQRAVRFEKGVVLKLLRRLPLRARNVVEMQYGRHLKRHPATGHVWLEYRGEDLKIAQRHGRVNEYRVDLTQEYPELVALLEEWKTTYRVRLPNGTEGASPYVFLTRHGNPFSARGLGYELAILIGMDTGTRWHQHTVRHAYATEYLEDHEDFTTVAIILGDSVPTIQRSYQVPKPELHHSRGSAWTHKQRRTG